MNKLIPLMIVAILMAVAGIYFYPKSTIESSSPIMSATPTLSAEPSQQIERSKYSFSVPVKSAHFESSTPEHEAILAGVPINVVVNFNFDLGEGSTIKILKNGVGGLDYGLGATVIDESKLAMRKRMDPEAPDQLYTVQYHACWPDKTCHDGQFQFVIDRTLASSFQDLTKQKMVNVELTNLQFSPRDIRVSKGTTVTWTNEDEVVHYVNTDSHPAHTYFPDQNSKALNKGDKYSVTFDAPGIYPYHCSAHAEGMKGNIIVE